MSNVKNTLGDLYNIFAEQLERLNDENLSEEQLDAEIKRTEAMQKISEPILKVADLQYKAWTTSLEYGINGNLEKVPRMLVSGE